MELAHIVDNKTEAAYSRGGLLEKRRQLMASWAGFVTASSGAIVSLSSA